MPLLDACKACAIGAFGEVLAEPASLLSAKPVVHGAGDRELRLRARELVLELLGERAPRAEQEGLERPSRDAENVGDLGVRAPFELAEHDCLSLLRRDLRQGREQLPHGRPLVFGCLGACGSLAA